MTRRRNSPNLYGPQLRTERSKLERPHLVWPICSITLCCFLAITASICALLAFVSAIVLYIQQLHKLAKRTKRRILSLSKSAAVVSAVVLTNLVLCLVDVANALEHRENASKSTPKHNAKTGATQPERTKLKLEHKQQSLIRSYSRSLTESYIPTIDLLLDEEEARQSSREISDTSRNVSIVAVDVSDHTGRMMQEASYFADWVVYPIAKDALEIAKPRSIRAHDVGPDEVPFNPWQSDNTSDDAP